MAKKAQAVVDSESAVRTEKIEELSRDLDRIRSNKLGFIYSGFLWGIVLGTIAVAILAVSFTLPFYGILPEYELPSWIGDERFFIAMFSIPILSSAVWIVWAIVRSSLLKKQIRKLEALQSVLIQDV